MKPQGPILHFPPIGESALIPFKDSFLCAPVAQACCYRTPGANVNGWTTRAYLFTFSFIPSFIRLPLIHHVCAGCTTGPLVLYTNPHHYVQAARRTCCCVRTTAFECFRLCYAVIMSLLRGLLTAYHSLERAIVYLQNADPPRNAAPYSRTACKQRPNIVFRKCCLTQPEMNPPHTHLSALLPISQAKPPTPGKQRR